ncbi:MAG: transcriptional regulator [Planctomycetes bacterium]|jgi:ArsR family transcriptional regulator|nr:transcriptional regulator [Planctomycetota bacterium]MDP6410152.1 metalloregulator ArsR/SmtB family transcription factor [Planctomycetota bacterium]
MIGLTGTSRLLKALADETRLRILHLLAREELSGTDLMEILNVGQSRISTHLTLLKEVGLVSDRRVGRRTHHSIAPGPAAGLWETALAAGGPTPEFEADLAGLDALRGRRQEARRAYFDRVAAHFGEVLLPGRTWEGLARALLQLAPRGRYLDVGIGDGLLTLMLAEVAETVSAVDISPEMLTQLERRARERGIENVEWIEGELEDLPLPDASHDCAVLSQALHHAARPERAVAEAWRVLAPGGRILVLDLLAHTEEWVRDKHQHAHLGFTEAALADILTSTGFADVRVQRAARDPQPPHFMTLVATGTRT